MTSRITERHIPETRLIRERDLWLVQAGREAVTRAMEKFHTDNPALYHAQRPTLHVCPYERGCPFTEHDTQ